MFLKLAWRNLWRNKRRTIILLASIVLAVVFACFIQSQKLGQYQKMIDNSVKYFTGYIQLHGSGFWEDKSIDRCFEMSDSIKNIFDSNEKIKEYIKRIESFALLSNGKKTKGIILIGIEPEKEDKLTSLSSKIIEGEYLQNHDRQVLLSEGLASYFKVKPGDTLSMISQGYHGANAVNLYVVKGIIKYPLPDLNNHLLYMSLNESQFFFDANNLISSLVITTDINDVESVTKDLKKSLASYEVMDWKEMLPELVQTIKFDKSISKLILIILYVIVSFGILGALFMMIYERNYEFGVLLASGLNRIKLQFVFLLENILLSTTGVILGFVIIFPILVILHYNPIPVTGDTAVAMQNLGIEPIMYFAINPVLFIEQMLTVLIISFLIGVYPLIRIKKLHIISAMRS